jgi:hypothetical protein
MDGPTLTSLVRELTEASTSGKTEVSFHSLLSSVSRILKVGCTDIAHHVGCHSYPFEAQKRAPTHRRSPPSRSTSLTLFRAQLMESVIQSRSSSREAENPLGAWSERPREGAGQALEGCD